MLGRRRILLPWLLAAMLMYGLSYVWHGVVLNDLAELRIPLPLYMTLAGLVYLVIGLGMTLFTHTAIMHEWISLRGGFPFKSALLGAAVGFFVYLMVFILGMSFAKHEVQHAVVDILWQMLEQGLGGLVISLGIIYDLHKNFLETER